MNDEIKNNLKTPLLAFTHPKDKYGSSPWSSTRRGCVASLRGARAESAREGMPRERGRLGDSCDMSRTPEFPSEKRSACGVRSRRRKGISASSSRERLCFLSNRLRRGIDQNFGKSFLASHRLIISLETLQKQSSANCKSRANLQRFANRELKLLAFPAGIPPRCGAKRRAS